MAVSERQITRGLGHLLPDSRRDRAAAPLEPSCQQGNRRNRESPRVRPRANNPWQKLVWGRLGGGRARLGCGRESRVVNSKGRAPCGVVHRPVPVRFYEKSRLDYGGALIWSKYVECQTQFLPGR